MTQILIVCDTERVKTPVHGLDESSLRGKERISVFYFIPFVNEM